MFILIATSMPSWALSLTEAVDLARRSDPTYLGAQANLRAAKERASQAFGALLPQASVTGNTTANRRKYEEENPFFPDAEASRERFNSKGYQVNVTQPLWHRANSIASKQAKFALAQADYQRAAAEQDLLVRLAQAWFDVMLAHDITRFTKSQLAAMEFQWKQMSHGAELGLASGPQSEEARSKYDQAVADNASAEADESVKIAALEQIIGPLPAQNPIPYLSDTYTPIDLHADSLDKWLDAADSQSPAILAALRGYDAATQEIRKQRAGHGPTLDAVATYGKNTQGAGTTPSQSPYTNKQATIGLQFTMPLYAGGTQSAKVREAIAMRDKAAEDLEAARRNIRLEIKQAWFGWIASEAKRKAAMQAVKFGSVTLQAAIKGQRTGVKTPGDMLQANQQLYSALRDLQKSRYEGIVSYFKLKGAIGQLVDGDLTAFDEWLVPESAAHAPGIPFTVAATPVKE